MRANYVVESIHNDRVVIRDTGHLDGRMTVTNDAEAVVEHLLDLFPGKRIFYWDSGDEPGELCHDGERFTYFGDATPHDM